MTLQSETFPAIAGETIREKIFWYYLTFAQRKNPTALKDFYQYRVERSKFVQFMIKYRYDVKSLSARKKCTYLLAYYYEKKDLFIKELEAQIWNYPRRFQN